MAAFYEAPTESNANRMFIGNSPTGSPRALVSTAAAVA